MATKKSRTKDKGGKKNKNSNEEGESDSEGEMEEMGHKVLPTSTTTLHSFKIPTYAVPFLNFIYSSFFFFFSLIINN